MIATQPYLEVTVAGLAQGAVFGLLALGLVLIYRTTGVLNFGHWAIGLMGITVYIGLTSVGTPVLFAVLITMATCAVIGWTRDCHRIATGSGSNARASHSPSWHGSFAPDLLL